MLEKREDLGRPLYRRAVICGEAAEFIILESRGVLEARESVGATVEVDDVDAVDALERLGSGIVP